MTFETGKEVTTKKSKLKKAVLFIIFGVIVCVALSLIVFKRSEEPKATSERAISTPPAEMLPAAQSPPQDPGNETTTPRMRTKTGNLLSNDSEIASIKPFKPDDFLSNAIRPDTRQERPSIRANSKISEEEVEEDEESETGKRGGPLKSSKKVKAGYPNEAVIFRNLQLKDENGKIPLDGMEKAREQLKAMQDEQKRLAIAAGKPEGLQIAGIAPGDWQWQGPGNIGGRMRSIIIHPTDPNKMWIGSVGGGIWKTTNGGTSWSPVNDFLANLAVSTMVIDPTNPNIMYAGTGEGLVFGFPIGPGLQGDGIFKTTDGGTTWNQLPSTKVSDPVVCPAGTPCPWTYVNRLSFSPDGTTILAATGSAVRRSTDGGATWTQVTANAARAYADIDFDPTNSQLAVAASNGLAIYSTDGGLTWLNSAFTPGTGGGRIELAYAPSSPNIVYASADINSGDVYRSTDGGQTFTQVDTAAFMPLVTQGFYDNIIWVNPLDPTFVIVGGVQLWRSTDSGASFTLISSALSSYAHDDHHMIVAHPGFNNNTNKTVYFGNDGGIYRANDVSTVAQTTAWTNLNNSLGITQFYGAAANSAGVIVGGTQDNGSLRSAANPNAWTSTAGGDGGFVAADPTDPNYFYTEYINLGIQRSTDGGTSASYIYCNPVPTNPNGGACMAPGVGITDAFNGANFIAPFILDPNDPNRLLAGGVSLWRSNDIKAAGMPTWAAIKPSIVSPISAIAVAQGNSDFVVVGHNNGQIFLSQDGTAAVPAWAGISAATPGRFVTRLAIDTTRFTPWIYATFGGFSADNVWRTQDLGVTWTDVTGSGLSGLPDVPVRSIVINPARQDQLHIGTEIGIFSSDNAGATWGIPQGGPANVSVDELFWNRGRLVAATHGRGIYKTILSGFAAPTCQPTSSSCTCAGEWNCDCSWASGLRPGPSDDVYVGCPMTVGSVGGPGISVRNLRTNGLTLLGNRGIATTEDFSNYGVTESSPNITSGMITARNFLNGGIISVGTVDVTGGLANGGTMRIGDLLEASKDILTGEQSALSARRIYAGGDFLNYSNAPLVLATTLSIGGNFHTQGMVQGETLGQAQHYSGASFARTYSGPGVLKFDFSGSGTNLTLANDKTFEVGNFHVSGPLNLGTNSMAVTDNTSFTGTGAVTGTGTIFLTPRTGVNATFSYLSASFTPTVRFVSGTYFLTGTNNLLGGPLVVDPGATLAASAAGISVNNNVTINGTLTTTGLSSNNSSFFFNGTSLINNGVISNNANQNFTFYFYGSSPTIPQTISGDGTWAPRTLQFGNNSISLNVNLANDLTFTGQNLQLLSSSTLGGTLNLGGHTLTHTGTTFSATATGISNGLLKVQPASGTYTLNGGVSPAGLTVASGTATAAGNIFIGGPLTIDSGATLAIAGSFIGTRNDVTVNGSLTGPINTAVLAQGNASFINNGTVSTSVTFAPPLNTPIVQNLGGTGTWGGTNARLFIGRFSTVTLLNDVTYGGTNLFLEGPGVRMNTGAFTFSMPCSVVWQNTGEIFGNVRQTNLAACPGAALTFGNPFTTIQFTSGTPPTDIRVETSSGAPIGFPSAVLRGYQITPTGGSGYTATLRLRYLDSELNGNTESTLQLWRHNGSAWTAQGATTRDSTNNWVEYAGVTQFSPWAIGGPLGPTAAAVSVSGRVRASDGRGIRNVSVSLTDQSGNVLRALTGSFGYYRFDNINAGQTVVLSVVAKSHAFASPTRIVSVQEDLAEIDFTAEPDVLKTQ